MLVFFDSYRRLWFRKMASNTFLLWMGSALVSMQTETCPPFAGQPTDKMRPPQSMSPERLPRSRIKLLIPVQRRVPYISIRAQNFLNHFAHRRSLARLRRWCDHRPNNPEGVQMKMQAASVAA
jgi:hypothetical protein